LIDGSLFNPNTKEIVFILDAGHAVERQLLDDWLTESQQKNKFGGIVHKVTVPIARQPEDILADGLQILDDLADDVLVMPLRVLWMRSEKLKGQPLQIRDFLKPDQSHPNHAQAIKILKKEASRALKVASSPATVGELRERFAQTGGEKNALAFAQYVAGQAALALDVEERRHRGGRHKVPRRVGQNIKNSRAFKKGLQQISDESGRTSENLLAECDVIMKELIATPQPFWLDLSGVITKKIASLAYESKVVVDEEDVAAVREIVAQYPTAFLWTHKTHVDGIALQKVLFENDLPATHTFGGLNMAFAGVGYLSRKSGVIFIRRTFQDNPLYKLILRHYIGYLLEKRFPFSWAFEGTRSRIGKLMPPRYGLLKYLIEAAYTTGTKNLHIFPVAINYDVIGDVGDYAREQAGDSKQAESLKWFVGYVRGLRKPMGRIYMDFGKPIVLKNAPNPEGDSLAIPKIAFQVAVEANRVTPITIASLVAMVLMSASPKALTREELSIEFELLLNWARDRKIPLSSDFDASNVIRAESIIDMMVNNKLVTVYKEGTVELLHVSTEQQAVASYYRNTTIHHFVVKAIAELGLLCAATYQGQPKVLFWEEIDRLRDLFKFEFFYAAKDEFYQQIRDELVSYDIDWEKHLRTSAAYADQLLKRFSPLVAYGTLIQFAEAYWVASSVLCQIPLSASLDEQSCINDSLSYGRQAHLQQRISCKSSIGKQLYANAFKLMNNLDLTTAKSPDQVDVRTNFQQDLRKLINRLERIRARALPQ